MSNHSKKNPKKQLPPDIYKLSVQEVEDLSGLTTASARRKLKEVRDKYGRKRYQPVFLSEYCNHFGYPLDVACKYLHIEYKVE